MPVLFEFYSFRRLHHFLASPWKYQYFISLSVECPQTKGTSWTETGEERETVLSERWGWSLIFQRYIWKPNQWHKFDCVSCSSHFFHSEYKKDTETCWSWLLYHSTYCKMAGYLLLKKPAFPASFPARFVTQAILLFPSRGALKNGNRMH